MNMTMKRRTLLAGGTALCAPLVMASTCTTQLATINVQVVADGSGIVNALLAIGADVVKFAPSIMSATTWADVQAGLNIAKSLITGLAPTTPAQAGATTLQVIEGYANTALSALAGVSGAAALAFPLLAPFVLPLQAVTVLLPTIEAYVNTYIAGPAVTVAAVRAKAMAPTMTPAQARVVLGLPMAA